MSLTLYAIAVADIKRRQKGGSLAQLSIYLAEFVFIWRVHPVFSHLLRGDTVRVTQRPFNAGYVRHGPAHVTGCRRRCG